MPELPEVETTLCGIAPHILNQTVSAVTIRQPKLRWQIPPVLPDWWCANAAAVPNTC